MRFPLTAFALLTLIVLPEVTQAELTRAEIIAQFKAWKDSFLTLRVEFTKEVVQASGEWEDLGTVTREIWIYSDANHTHWHFYAVKDQSETARQLWLVNGDRRYKVEYPYEDSEFGKPERVIVQQRTPTSTVGIPYVIRVCGLGDHLGWLPESLESGALQAELRVVGDQKQIEVDGANADPVIIVDPEHSCLPVQYGRNYFVTEFQQSDGIWFPLRGRYVIGKRDNPDVIEWVVDRVEFNLEFPESVFEPPVSPDAKGVEVVDQITGFVDLQGEVDETGALVPAKSPVHTSQVDQELSKQDWSNSLILLLLLLAFAGIIIWRWVM